MELLIGADPELFVYDKKARKVVTGHGLIPGTKSKPFQVEKGAVQVDGMALEFNIDPAPNFETFQLNVETVLKKMQSMIPENLRLEIKSAHEFQKKYLESMPDEAKELGCDPDFNAYTEKENPRPNAASRLRTAAGHIHVGWTRDQDPFAKNHMVACLDVVKEMDFLVGFTTMNWDKDHRRRRLYGKAGAFRPKPYGVEYRVLSNAWLASPERMKWVFNRTHQAVSNVVSRRSIIPHIGGPGIVVGTLNGDGRYNARHEEWLWHLMERLCNFSRLELPE